ncbi:MAG TPA: hypothetical protein V6D22_09085 [Candidatus Obscuribacterales bacterium]
MARILLADVRTGIERLSQALSGEHDLHRATTGEEARHILRREPIDLIVCELDFDESKMIDFLMDLQRDEVFKRIPFICWQNEQSSLSDSCINASMQAAAVLGACLCLDWSQVQAMTNDQLKAAIEKCLMDSPARILAKARSPWQSSHANDSQGPAAH